MGRDWIAWHRDYDDPGSSLSQRLQVVRREVRAALAGCAGVCGEVRVMSLCAGDGRDLLPVLAERAAGPLVRALLVELDPTLATRVRAGVAELGLSGVEVRAADAGRIDAYTGYAPAHLVLACGVFGNITAEDAGRTVAALPALLTDDGVVIWTRGRGDDDDGPDPSQRIRAMFAARGFAETSFTAPADARFRVGVHRLATRSVGSREQVGADDRMFTFAR